MQDQTMAVLEAASSAAMDNVPSANAGGNLLRTAATLVDQNPIAAGGIAVVAVAGIGYLAYRAFSSSDKE